MTRWGSFCVYSYLSTINNYHQWIINNDVYFCYFNHVDDIYDMNNEWSTYWQSCILFHSTIRGLPLIVLYFLKLKTNSVPLISWHCCSCQNKYRSLSQHTQLVYSLMMQLQFQELNTAIRLCYCDVGCKPNPNLTNQRLKKPFQKLLNHQAACWGCAETH